MVAGFGQVMLGPTGVQLANALVSDRIRNKVSQRHGLESATQGFVLRAQPNTFAFRKKMDFVDLVGYVLPNGCLIMGGAAIVKKCADDKTTGQACWPDASVLQQAQESNVTMPVSKLYIPPTIFN